MKATLQLDPLRLYQRRMYDDTAQNVMCVSSTQVGKTWMLSRWICAGALCDRLRVHPSWWLAPVYNQVEQGAKYCLDFARRSGIYRSFKQHPYPILTLINGATIEFRSWERSDNLLGTSIARAVVDEAGLLTTGAQAIISTRRSATMGPIRYIGNPGHTSGPFRKLCGRAESDDTGRYSLHKWTWEDLYAALLEESEEKAEMYREFIEDERRDLVEYEFRRLYEAEWTADQYAVFQGVWDASRDEESNAYRGVSSPEAGHSYVAGVDVGEVTDYAVICVLDVDLNRPVFLQRNRGVDLGVVALQHREIQSRFQCPITVEQNFIGNALMAEYRSAGVIHQPFKTTRNSKQEIIHMLAVEIAQQRMTLAELPPLQHELEVYRYDRAPSGNYSYGAPSGEHDDCVIALALAFWGKTRGLAGNLEGIGWV